MENANSEILKKHFNFLLSTFKFELNAIKSYNYALYAKFLSNSIGIYFIYEFRDYIPQIQFAKLKAKGLHPRPGLYTIKELYKDADFKLQSFYLDEIMLFKGLEDYEGYFKNVKTIEEALKIIAELTEKYAKDFVAGDGESYAKMESWFRVHIMT